MKLKIRKFDATTIKSDAVVLLIGKRGSGKTTLMKDLMYHMREKLDFGLAMSPTEETTESLSSFVPPSCIYNTFSSPALDVMLELQRQQVKSGRFRNVYLLLDDCMYDKKIMAGVNTRQLFMNGRHRKIFFMNSVQYMMDMPAALRTQVDYVFALKENIIASREKLHKFFFGMFEDFRDFNKVMNSCTQNYECIVLDNTCKTGELTDTIFWYKADPALPRFQLGRPVFWDLDRMYYKDRDSDRQQAAERQSVMGVRDYDRDVGATGGGNNILMIEKADAHGARLRSS